LGRFALGDARALRERGGVVESMGQLLALGGARTNSHFTTAAGLRLHHLDAGNGPAVVLLHGACGGAANWFRLIAPLARTHRVIALDLPGFGLSDAIEPRPPLGGQIAELVAAWLEQLGIASCSVVGTSFGALPAFRLAQRDPGRVQRVALIDAVGLGRELPLPLRIASLPPLAPLALRPSRFGTRWQFRELMISHDAQVPPADEEGLLEYLWQSAVISDQRRLQRAFSMFSDLRGQREVLTDAELRSFSTPLLLVWGEHDRFLPVAHGRRAAALVPRAQLRIIPRVGHSPNWEAPEAVFECLSAFLDERPRL
ncbi:MAG: alpha/beta fold hydrolase, partial [Gemmatimonadota bacterium]